MSDAELDALDLAVALRCGWEMAHMPNQEREIRSGFVLKTAGVDYSPTRDWRDCGEVMEMHRVAVAPSRWLPSAAEPSDVSWTAWVFAAEAEPDEYHGPTARIAICRAIGALPEASDA